MSQKRMTSILANKEVHHWTIMNLHLIKNETIESPPFTDLGEEFFVYVAIDRTGNCRITLTFSKNIRRPRSVIVSMHRGKTLIGHDECYMGVSPNIVFDKVFTRHEIMNHSHTDFLSAEFKIVLQMYDTDVRVVND